MSNTSDKYRVRVTGIIEENSDTRSLVLEPVGTALTCRSGQFFTFIFYSPSGKELRRSYSLSSSPELGEPITVTVKRIPNGEVSRRIFSEVEVGMELTTIGASGLFVLPDDAFRYQLVFFAAGTGITPILSLMKFALHRYPGIKILLLYSNSSNKNVLFANVLRQLEAAHPENLRIQYFYSDSKDLRKSRLTPELLPSILEQEHITASGNALFYVCGPGGYMRMVNFSVLHWGVAADKIKKEIFHVQAPAVIPVPPDTRPRRIRLQVADKTYNFSVQYPTTILQAARSADVPIPYSCETGQCGTCVAKCLQGEVWMSRNEVLLDHEISQGIILTCTGYPVYGDVILQR